MPIMTAPPSYGTNEMGLRIPFLPKALIVGGYVAVAAVAFFAGRESLRAELRELLQHELTQISEAMSGVRDTSAVLGKENLGEARTVEARRTAADADITMLYSALRLYKLDNGSYPTAAQGLGALVAMPTDGPVSQDWKRRLEKLPVDPWGRPYNYANPGKRDEVEVFSSGPDGLPGTGDDIGYWEH